MYVETYVEDYSPTSCFENIKVKYYVIKDILTPDWKWSVLPCNSIVTFHVR